MTPHETRAAQRKLRRHENKLSVLDCEAAELRSKMIGGDGDDKHKAKLGAIETRRAKLIGKITPLRKVVDQASEDAWMGALRGDFANLSAEQREYRRLSDAFSVVDVLRGVLKDKPANGATAELQTEFRMASDHVPIELLARAMPHVEKRAVSPAPGQAPAADVVTGGPVFAMGDAAFLQITSPVVESGQANTILLTSKPTVGGPHSDSTAAASTTGVFTAEAQKPQRLTAEMSGRRTDWVLSPSAEMLIRAALGEALSEAYDAQVVSQIETDVARVDATAAGTVDTLLKRLIMDNVDGSFAADEMDVRVLMGTSIFAFAGSKFRGATGDISALQAMRASSGGIRASAHIAAAQASKQDCIVRRGMRPDFVAPVWRGVRLIVDEYTKKSEGEIEITAEMLAAFKTVRTDGFKRIQVQTA